MLIKSNKRRKEENINVKRKSVRIGLFFVLVELCLLNSVSPATNISDKFDCTFSARDEALGEIGESIPFNPAGVCGNPASISGVSGILYAERYLPFPESSGYIHSAAILYSHDKFTEFIFVQTGFSTSLQKGDYFNFDFPGSQFLKGSAGIAYAPVSSIILGMGGNVFQDKTAGDNTMGFSGNAGLQIRTRFLTVSAGGRNLGFNSSTKESALLEEISPKYSTGLFLGIFGDILKIGGQVEYSENYELNGYALGGEFAFAKTIYIRAGYKAPTIDFYRISDENYSVGAGLKIGKITADYAIKINPENQNNYIHYMTFGITDIVGD